MMPADIDRMARVLLATVGDAAVRGFVVLCVMGLAIVMLRRKRAAVRVSAWTLVLYGALAVPVLGLGLPAWSWQLPTIQVVEEFRPAPLTPLVSGSSTFAGIGNPSVDPPPVVPEKAAISWPTVAAGIYLAGVFAMCLHAGLGWYFTRRLRLSSRAIADAGALTKLDWYSSLAGLRASPRLVESPRLFVPVAMSVLRPIVALPDDWREWPESRLDAVLLHEVAHVARRDALRQRLSLFYRALVWFSPVSWWLHRHLSNLADQACDEAALDAGIDPATYAGALLDFFARLPHGSRRAAWHLAMASRADAEAASRVERILSWKGGSIMTRSKLFLTAVVLAALPVVGLTASVSLTPEVVRFAIPAVPDRVPGVSSPSAVPAVASFIAASMRPRTQVSSTHETAAPEPTPDVQAQRPDAMETLIATLKNPALTIREEQALAKKTHSGVVQVFEVQTVAPGLQVGRPYDSIQKDVPTMRIMVEVGAADPQGSQYFLAFETTDFDHASKLRKGDQVFLTGNLAQFVGHRDGYNNLPDKWLIFDQVVIAGTAGPADTMFTAANFPGSSTADRNSAKELYALLTGRVSSIDGKTTPVFVEPRQLPDDFAKGAYEINTPGLVAPQVIIEVKPRYTPDAMRKKITGAVTVEIIVSADGTVGKARIRQSLDKESGLDEAALEAARKWKFRPGILDGKPVPVRQEITLEFRLH